MVQKTSEGQPPSPESTGRPGANLSWPRGCSFREMLVSPRAARMTSPWKPLQPCADTYGVSGPGPSGGRGGEGHGAPTSGTCRYSFLNVLHHLDHFPPGTSREGCALPEPLAALFLHCPLQGISCLRLSSQLNLPFSLGAKSRFVIFHLYRQPPVRPQPCSPALPGESDPSREGPDADRMRVLCAPSCRAS